MAQTRVEHAEQNQHRARQDEGCHYRFQNSVSLSARRGQKIAASLLEVLISLALFSLILGLTALLISSYQRLVRQGRARLAVVQAATVALEDIGQEARESLAVLATGSELGLRRLCHAPGRLPLAYPTPAPALSPAFLPHPAEETVEVYFRVLGDGHLWRQSGGFDGTTRAERLVDRPQQFACSLEANGTLSLLLSLKVEDRVESLRLTIYRPLP